MISRKTIIIALALALSAATVVDRAGSRVPPGETLASHTLTSFDGSESRLSSFKGDILVVNFWASWCEPCRKELPVMNGWHTAWVGRGARVVAISIDKEVRNARRFAEQADLTMGLYHDGPTGLARTLDLPSLPCTFLLDADGNVVSVIKSGSASDLATLHQQVEALLASRAQSEGGSPSQQAPMRKSVADADNDGGTR